jgi:hypothetical protein
VALAIPEHNQIAGTVPGNSPVDLAGHSANPSQPGVNPGAATSRPAFFLHSNYPNSESR